MFQAGTSKAPLPKAQFNKPVLEVAASLIGRYLVRKNAVGTQRFLITEVEAYDGERDLACHASRGRTKRTEVMYGEAGHWYVYLCYGVHEMLNIVTGPREYPAAVLIRGVEGISGPGRLTKSTKITRALNGKPAVPASGLWIEESGIVVPKIEVMKTPRVGVGYAKEWAQKPWRFVWVPGSGT